MGSIASLMNVPVQAAEGDPDQIIRLQTGRPAVINDTDGDGLGEFEGWGTSLCWWANRIGYSEALTQDAAKKFFSDEGLDLNIGRYNLGGGDLTTPELNANPKCVLYGLDEEHHGPQYAGSSMSVSTNSYNSSTLWQMTDRDMGILKGTPVGSQKEIGWIGPLDGEVGKADTLKYTVHADKAGAHKVKLLFKLIGGNDGRYACIRVNGDKVYTITDTEAEQNVAAVQGNTKLYLGTIEDVELKEGDNTIEIGGSPEAKNSFMYDFASMSVVPADASLEHKDSDPGLHKEHIIRSDSAVPGYWTDVTPIVLDEEKTIDWYKEHFTRVDESCGYAWNYDWNADKDQLNVLKAVKAASDEDFIAEIFSNSPPYFMTESQCSTGNYDANRDNLRDDSYDAFAAYIADVIEHLHKEGIEFQSATAFNEPNTNYWGAYSNKQEGCHFDASTISEILTRLDAELQRKGIDLILSASDETSLDTQITVFNNLTEEAKNAVERIDVHTYSGSNRKGVKDLAISNEKNLWMSEVDGGFTGGENAGEMSAAIGLGQRIIEDVTNLDCSAWIFWNLVDKHADSSERGMSYVNKGSGIDKATIDDLNWEGQTGGYWGVGAADHNNEEIVLSMKYYGFGQFTRYIRPGYALFDSTGNTLFAYDPIEQKAVIVAINNKADDSLAEFDLSGFDGTPTKITAIRTSGSMDDGEKWADVSNHDSITIHEDTQSFIANLKGNSITTYIVEGVGDVKNADERPMEMITVDNDHISSSTPWQNSSTNTAYTLQDGNYNTFFDGLKDGYVTYDLQKETEIAAVSFAPRNGYADRCKGAVISGSHDGQTWTPLYSITSTPASNTDTFVYADGFNAKENTFRYIRYMNSATEANISEFKVYTYESALTWNLKADYDMNVAKAEDGASSYIADSSKNHFDAALNGLDFTNSASYEDSSVLAFNGKGYATLPAGLIENGESFTISTTAWAPAASNHWLFTLGTKEGQWPNVKNYFFLTPSSAQGGYNSKMLAAISDSSGETRLPAPADTAAKDSFENYTITSNGKTITVYINGKKVSEVTHDRSWDDITNGDFTGYLGKSLYTPDPLFNGSMSSFKVWNTVLSEEEIAAITPDQNELDGALKAALAGAILNGNTSADEITSDISLPTSINGQNVSWTISEDAPVDDKGHLSIPLTDTDFTLTATFTDTNKAVTLNLRAPGEDANKIVADAKEALDIPHADDICGNITLPESIGKANIVWSMSENGNGIIDLEEKAGADGYDPTPAGVVTRPEEDTAVTLTATISYKDVTETKTFDLTIKAAPKEQKEYTDYFFAYFTGEGSADGEQVYFSTSQDGLNWNDLNNGKPTLRSELGEKGVRDPYILRSAEGDRFFIIATDLKINGGNGWDAAQTKGSQSLLVWESKDLIDWGEPRLVPVSASIEAGCTWAPEATYDEKTGEYVVYWSSKVAADNYAKQRVYYVKTRDFYTFTEPKVWIEKDQSSIDTTVIKEGDTYYRLTKNEGGNTNELGAKTKTLFLEKSNSLLGEYTHIPSDSLNNTQYVEGPAIYKRNADDSESDQWILLADDFGGIGYFPLETADLASGQFTRMSDGFKMPNKARHGTPIAITADEYDALMKAHKQVSPTSTWYVDDTHNNLPETVEIGHTAYPVEWDLNALADASANAKPFDTITVNGKATLAEAAEDETLDVTAKVQQIPANLEYMIDCNSPTSLSHKYALESSSLMKNTTPDQSKTDDNTWGALSIIGNDNNADITPFGNVDNSNPYNGGYWARGGKTIDYAVTLPAGDHTIMVGNSGWWSMGRTMELIATTSNGEVKITDCNAQNSTNLAFEGKLHLDKEETVRLTIRKTDGNDPILSWLAVSSDSTIDKTALANRIEEIEGENLEIAPDASHKYTNASWKALNDAIANGKAILDKADATQTEIDQALTELNNAREGLVLVNLHPALIVSNYAHALDLSIFFEKGQSEMNANLEATDAQIEAPESQEALESSTGNLNRSLFELRIKPSEDILKDRYGK